MKSPALALVLVLAATLPACDSSSPLPSTADPSSAAGQGGVPSTLTGDPALASSAAGGQGGGAAAGAQGTAGYRDGTDPVDPFGPTGNGPACNCELEDGVLTVSWDCFCFAFHACEPARQCFLYGGRADSAACGLSVVTAPGFGEHRSVYDADGKLVGREIMSDTTLYTCPDNRGLMASTVRSGTFPAADCQATSCADCANDPFPCSGR